MNPAHAENRRRMAEHMAARMWRDMSAHERRSLVLVSVLHDADPSYRRTVARQTGRDREPSEETWSLFLALLRARMVGFLRAEPIECPTCDGLGGASVATCSHSGNCPCGGEPVECPDCEGTGRVRCDHCPDERPAVALIDGDPICYDCLDVPG